MPSHADNILDYLAKGPATAAQLIDLLSVSQPTLSRVMAGLGEDVVRLGAARSIRYARRDTRRGLPDMAIYRVDVAGRLARLGVLIPVCPEGFVMRQEDGITLPSEGLPWWLLDMRPQGYLGRAYAARYAAELGLPERLSHWTDTHALRALLIRGQDGVGNLLLGELAREQFLAANLPSPIGAAKKGEVYAQLSREAAKGETPGSSAGGEQPKFTAFADTPDGPRHVIVKFTEGEKGAVTERWRDILLAEHLALSALCDAGVSAAKTRVVDHGGQRFLEAQRFDRVGPLGRLAVFSLAALDAEFVGVGAGPWPVIVERLAAGGYIRRVDADEASLLWAYGTLIGNSDMHNGNLSFIADEGRPCSLAPAYDMTTMAFAPRSGGGLPDGLPEAGIQACVSNQTWRRAEQLARDFLARVRAEEGFSRRFGVCIAALGRHIEAAAGKIGRLG